jgi:hypothetical protein
MLKEQKCYNCGNRFMPYHNSDCFCSKRCRIKYNRRFKIKPKCSDCGCIGCKYHNTYSGKCRPRACDLD